MSADTEGVTVLIERIREGDETARSLLYSITYAELRSAARRVAFAGKVHSMQPTQIVNEAYLKLAGNEGTLKDRPHFLATATLAMKQVLADSIKQRTAKKRGGGIPAQALEDVVVAVDDQQIKFVELHDVLEHLRKLDRRAADIVEYRLYAGLSIREIATVLGRDEASIGSEWRFAKAWLQERLQ